MLDTEKAIKSTEITFVTVGTPSNSDGSIDLTQIKGAAKEIGNALNKKDGYHLVIVKSTVVPGTTEDIVKPLLEKTSHRKCGSDFGLCMNPEFLREGSAVHDAQHPDRIVIGENDQKSGDTLQSLYRELHQEELIPIIRTNLPTAELIKYANNSFLATKISYINTIANICEKIPGADVTMVSQGIGLDQRINPQFLKAGLGYGGSCFPKDVRALINTAKAYGCTPSLVEAVDGVNNRQKGMLAEKIKTYFMEKGGGQGKTVALWGLAFKANTDDMRESAALNVIQSLTDAGMTIRAYDPVAGDNARKILRDNASVTVMDNQYDTIHGADALVVVTDWNQFRNPDFNRMKRMLKDPVIFDGRNLFSRTFMRDVGFSYISVGRQPVIAER